MAASVFKMVVAVYLPISRYENALRLIRPFLSDGDLVRMHIFVAEPNSEYLRPSCPPLGFCEKLLQFGVVLFHHYRLLVSVCLLDSLPNQGKTVTAQRKSNDHFLAI